MNTERWLPLAPIILCFAVIAICAVRFHQLEQRVDQLRIVTPEPAPKQPPATMVYVDCPQVEIEPYDDEPFTPIPIEEILEQAKERRRKLARMKTAADAARPSAVAAPDSASGSQPSSQSAD